MITPEPNCERALGIRPSVSAVSFDEEGSRVVRRIHHVGIVVRDLAEAYRFYRDTLSLPLVKEALIRDQGVRAALLAAGDSEIELLAPLDAAKGSITSASTRWTSTRRWRS